MKQTFKFPVAGRIAMAGAAASATYLFTLRPWLLHWGATEEEGQMPLPGDHLVPQPRYISTRAITIQTPPVVVWPWLVQMGQGRAGLYSYDWLENLAGCDIHSADRIIPELQTLQVGDVVRLIPEGRGPLYFEVAILQPYRALVLRSPGDPAANLAAGFPSVAWAFVLEKRDEHTTRLLVRFRSDYRPGLLSTLGNQVLLEPIQFIMERKMLLGIKERAERSLAEFSLQPVPAQAVEGNGHMRNGTAVLSRSVLQEE
ncbi:MAG: hypothetical protein L0332_29510 [Chloroflexi bacterium]|nr:hypothetical protein [Chloroflexota bacterium]MCI0575669.1 hypothetical protein [Chloroflexota bacterium]MCI0647528.1 hypothetical protein [Chloroflexota bacterium]MCI0730839.1 hypothetical protein [Chloroflexota bacterium]